MLKVKNDGIYSNENSSAYYEEDKAMGVFSTEEEAKKHGDQIEEYEPDKI